MSNRTPSHRQMAALSHEARARLVELRTAHGERAAAQFLGVSLTTLTEMQSPHGRATSETVARVANRLR